MDFRKRVVSVVDVESIGLHGEAFAVAMHTCKPSGEVLDEVLIYCNPGRAQGSLEDRAWVTENCDPKSWACVDLPAYCGVSTMIIEGDDTEFVRMTFWEHWKGIESKYMAVMAADVAWPVEARFLAACIQDSIEDRKEAGPYPLIDIASVRLGAGLDPLAEEEERTKYELPAHHPLADARQSARLLREAYGRENFGTS